MVCAVGGRGGTNARPLAGRGGMSDKIATFINQSRRAPYCPRCAPVHPHPCGLYFPLKLFALVPRFGAFEAVLG